LPVQPAAQLFPRVRADKLRVVDEGLSRKRLNRQGIPKLHDSKWASTQVMRVLARAVITR
jgi:hypothetical protein